MSKGRERFVADCPYVDPNASDQQRQDFNCPGGQERACQTCESNVKKTTQKELIRIGVPGWEGEGGRG